MRPRPCHLRNFASNRHLGDVISHSFGATEETFPAPVLIFKLHSAYFNAHPHGVSVLAGSADSR